MQEHGDLVFSATSVTAITAVISSVAAALTHVITAKGKWRAEAADVFIDAALHEREDRKDLSRKNELLSVEMTKLAATITAICDSNVCDAPVKRQLLEAVLSSDRVINNIGNKKRK